MKVTRKVIARKKVEKKVLPKRNSNAAKFLDEKHIGEEVTNWASVKDVESAIFTNLRHYGYFYDYKTAHSWAVAWVKKNFPAKVKALEAAEDWTVTTTLGGLCKMHMDGAPLGEHRLNWMRTELDKAIKRGHTTIEAKANQQAKLLPPSDPIKKKASEFIAEVESVIDSYHSGDTLDVQNYSPFNELKKIEAPKSVAERVLKYYKPLFDEVQELITKKTPDLVEGYKHLKSLKEKKEFLQLIQRIVDDCVKYIGAATAERVKAPRKPREKKKVPAEKLAAKVQFQKDSAEYKVSSMNPTTIIGASEAYLFNTKYRTMTKVVALEGGLTIRGTSIINIDESQTKKKALRKPESFLTSIAKTTRLRVAKAFEELTTKDSPGNGRINQDTIILKVY